MVRVDGLEFNGIAYITVDKSGTWVWEVKPELKGIDGKLGWYLPEKYHGPGMTMLMNQVNGSVLPTLLNGSGKDFNDTLTVFDKPRIFKIVLEEVSYWKDEYDSYLKILDDALNGKYNTQQPNPEGSRNED